MADGIASMKVGEKRRLFATVSTTGGALTITSALATIYKPDGTVLTGYDLVNATGFDADADSYVRAWLDFDASELAAGQYAVVFTITLTASDGADLRPEVEIALTVSAVP